MRLGWMMVFVAAVALGLGAWAGLQRRRERLHRLGVLYSRAAMAWEAQLLAGELSDERAGDLLARVHWNDMVAGFYYSASSHPWWPGEPDPLKAVCGCGGCVKGSVPRYSPTKRDVIAP